MTDKSALTEPLDKVSYIIGNNIGKSMKQDGVNVNPDALASGLRDALGGTSAIPDSDAKAIMTTFQNEMRGKQEATAKASSDKNGKAGDEFLAANKSKDGVKTTASGLQYKIITSGTGKTPKLTDTVTTNYSGKLLDGTEFDSSYKRGQPASFPVNGVIPGWTEALQLMKEGDKWELYIPAKLAYAEHGAGAAIPPNATLVFQIELISVGAPAKK